MGLNFNIHTPEESMDLSFNNWYPLWGKIVSAPLTEIKMLLPFMGSFHNFLGSPPSIFIGFPWRPSHF